MLTMKDIHRMRKELRAENNKYHPFRFVDIPKDKWPPLTPTPFRVCRSSRFLCQLYNDKGFTRISINRAEINDQGGWKDGITWDELQNIKSQLGYADQQAVEVFPAEKDLVNVANIRHLWIVSAAHIPFLWRNNRPTQEPQPVENDKQAEQFRREMYGDWSKHEQPLTSVRNHRVDILGLAFKP